MVSLFLQWYINQILCDGYSQENTIKGQPLSTQTVDFFKLNMLLNISIKMVPSSVCSLRMVLSWLPRRRRSPSSSSQPESQESYTRSTTIFLVLFQVLFQMLTIWLTTLDSSAKDISMPNMSQSTLKNSSNSCAMNFITILSLVQADHSVLVWCMPDTIKSEDSSSIILIQVATMFHGKPTPPVKVASMPFLNWRMTIAKTATWSKPLFLLLRFWLSQWTPPTQAQTNTK